jgi:hypothetical protein
MTNKLIGKDLIQKPLVRSWTPETSWTTTKVYKGTPERINTLVAELQKAGTTIKKLEEGNPLWTLEVETGFESGGGGGGGQAVGLSETWELGFNQVNKPLETFPYYKSATFNTRSCIYVWKKLYEQGELPIPTAARAVEASEIEGFIDMPILNNYIEQRLKGIDSYDVALPVIRLTQSMAKETQAKASMLNVNRVVAAADIGLPSGTLSKFALPQQEGGKAWEWVKKYPTITKQRMRYNISQEWWGFETASKMLYGGSEEP